MAAFDLGPNANPDFTANTGAENALSFGRTLQANHALQGIDFNSPASLDSAITGLTKAGAGEQATALMNLSTARMVRSQILPTILNHIANAGQSSDQAQPQSAQAPADPNQPMTDHANETMGMARQAVASLQQTPLAERPAAFDKIKGQLVARGVPEAAVDAAGEDLSDAGLQKYGAYLDAHNAAVNPGEGQQPTPMPDHPTGYAWAKSMLNDPVLNAPGVPGLLKSYAGFDLDPQIGRAERIMSPEIAKEAEQAHAGPIAAATEAGKLSGGNMDLNLPDGSKITVPGAVGQQLLRGLPAGTFKTPGTEQSAEMQAHGSASGTAPYDVIHTTLNGTPIDLPKDAFLKLQAQGIPGLGKGLSPGEAEAQTGDAAAFVKTVANASDPNRQTELNKAVTNGQMIVGLAKTIGTGKYTEGLNQLAQAFPNLKGPKEYATNASLLAQDLSASFRDELSGMAVPRLNSEAKSILGAIPHNTNPRDQVGLYGALMTGAARFAQAHDQFMVNWGANGSNPKSQTASQAAWNNGPGRLGMLGYAVPELEHMTINGHPAIKVDPKSGLAVFMPDFPNQSFTFRAK